MITTTNTNQDNGKKTTKRRLHKLKRRTDESIPTSSKKQFKEHDEQKKMMNKESKLEITYHVFFIVSYNRKKERTKEAKVNGSVFRAVRVIIW